jgi:isopenicillin-N N-acyltransferase like protein
VSLAVAEVTGGPRALGFAQGSAFSEEIAQAIDFYMRLAAENGGDFALAGAGAMKFLKVAAVRVPGQVLELEGLADGAGAPLEAIAALNCFEEVESWAAPESCTTMISGPFLMHAEQWYANHDRVTVVVARPESGPPFVSPTCAGFLPAVGMNASGFAQGIDSLSDEGDRLGIPRVLVSRSALGARDIEGAIGAACMEGRAGGYAHVLATVDRRLVVETSATGVGVLNRVTAHTNHYLQKPSYSSPGSVSRLHRAEELLRRRPPESFDECTELLSDHHGDPESICLHEEGLSGSGTVFGMVCNLETGRMIVSDGPPCSGQWEEFFVPDYEGVLRVV